MKTKEEILKMSAEELSNYKWSDDLDKKEDNYNYSDCSYCTNCFNCSYCFNCSDCLYCRKLKNKKDGYYICNVEVSKKEFEKKKKEIKK